MEKDKHLLYKFDGKPANFEDWRGDFEAVMAIKELDEAMSDTWDREYAAEVNGKKKAEMKKKNEQLYYYLRLFVSKADLGIMQNNLKNGNSAWKELTTKYVLPVELNVGKLKRKLNSITLESCGGKITDYLNKIRELSQQINKLAPNSLTEQGIIGIVIYGLPKDTRRFVLTAPDASRRTLNAITELLTNFARYEEMESDEESKSATVFQINQPKGKFPPRKLDKRPEKKQEKQNKEKKSGKKEEFKYKCHFCDAVGHKKADCRLRIAWMDSRNQKNGESVNTSNEKEDEKYLFMTNMEEVNSIQVKSNWWLVDTGASTHICNDLSKFTEFSDANKGIIAVFDGHQVVSSGTGSVNVKFAAKRNGEDYCVDITLQDVMYTPTSKKNIISVNRMIERGHTVGAFDKLGSEILLKGSKDLTIPISKVNRLYYVQETYQEETNYIRNDDGSFEENIRDKLLLLHLRTGHSNVETLYKLKDHAIGVEFNARSELKSCEICLRSKLAKTSFGERTRVTTTPMELIHSDIAGPMNTPGIFNKELYVISFIDDLTRFQKMYPIKKKSDSLDALKTFIAEVPNQIGLNIRTLRTDNGGEYISNEFKKYCIDNGIKQEFTTPYSPEQNGLAERAWRSNFEMVRSMLLEANLGNQFWSPATFTACYIKNRLVHSATGKTPYEMLYGKKPDLSHLRIFGSPVIFKNMDPVIKKLEDRGIKGIFVGYSERSKGYIIWNPKTRKFVVNRNVTFLERMTKLSPEVKNEPKILIDDTPSVTGQMPLSVDTKAPAIEPYQEVEQPEQPEEELTRRSGRNRTLTPKGLQLIADQKAKKGRNKIHMAVEEVNIAIEEEIEQIINVTNDKVPRSAEMALKDLNWKRAMEEEMESLNKNETWILVKPPPGRKLVDSKWVFKVKENENGEETRKKARLVAKGFSQKYGIDYEETFSPVMKMVTLRTLIALSTFNSWHIKYADFESAYLQSEMDEEIYMKQPAGFVKLDEDGKPLACLLKKSLYGLKQSGRNWNLKINNWLKTHGFARSKMDTCLYTRTQNGETMAILIYVDDMIGFVRDPQIWKDLVQEMKKDLKVNDLGDANWILGMKLTNSEDKIELDQSKYIKILLERHGMEDAKPAKTPMAQINEEQFNKEEELRKEQQLENRTEYMKIVGGLIYASIITRPDIAYAVSKLGQHMSDPSQIDMTKAKRVLRYLKGTLNLKICYSKGGNKEVFGYTDSDWAGDYGNRRSTSGYVFLLAGAAISWSSKRQETVALSSTEAEYIALAHATQEAIFIRGIVQELKIDLPGPTTIFADNQSCIKIATNQVTRNRTKHISTKFHFAREKIESKEITLEYKPTEHMTADSFTKSIGVIKLEKINSEIFGIGEYSVRERVLRDRPE